jgi:uncharacterized protein YkwD
LKITACGVSKLRKALPGALLVLSVLGACGGGGGGGTTAPTAAGAATGSSSTGSSSTASVSTTALPTAAAGPASTVSPAPVPVALPDPAVVADAAFARMNALRQMAGVASLQANASIGTAARLHSMYMSEVDQVGHYETVTTATNYRGYSPMDRLAAQGLTPPYMVEGLTRAVGIDGSVAVDLLVTSIYHRFGLFNDYVTASGAGASLKQVNGLQMLDLTIDAAHGQTVPMPAAPALTIWPVDQAAGVSTGFDSDSESPDPIPDKNKVGYPVSVQTDPRSALAVTRFTLSKVSDGSLVAARILSAANDPNTPAHAASLIPESVLSASTAYQASFTGTVDGNPVTRSWTFVTAAYSLTPDRATVAPGSAVSFKVAGIDATESYFVCWDNASLLAQGSLQFTSSIQFSLQAKTGCSAQAGCPVTVTVARDSGCSTAVASATVAVTP